MSSWLWALRICLLRESVSPLRCAGGLLTTLLVQCLICCLCAFRPRDYAPWHLTLDHRPSLFRALSLTPYKCSSWETGPSGSGRYHLRLLISGVCCFVFSICRCPRTKASATAQLHGEMAWPRARVLRQVVGPWRLLHAMGR